MRRTYREGASQTSSRYLFLAFFRAFRKGGRLRFRRVPRYREGSYAVISPRPVRRKLPFPRVKESGRMRRLIVLILLTLLCLLLRASSRMM